MDIQYNYITDQSIDIIFIYNNEIISCLFLCITFYQNLCKITSIALKLAILKSCMLFHGKSEPQFILPSLLIIVIHLTPKQPQFQLLQIICYHIYFQTLLILFLQDRFEKVKFLVEVCRYILILSIKIKISRGITLTFCFFYTYFFEGLPFCWVQSDISLLKTLICISLIVSLKNNTYIHIYIS